MAKKWPGMVVQRTFTKENSFVYRLHDSFIPILSLLAYFWLFYLKTNDNDAYMWVIKQNKHLKGWHWQ